MGRLTEKALNVFHIETTVNNRMFDRPLEFLHKNEDDWTGAERAAFKGAHVHALQAPAGRRARPSSSASRRPTASPASSRASARPCTSRRSSARYAQYLVPIHGQADILVTGIPYISPYNVNSFLNPLLVQVMAQGYLFNLYKGAPLVKKGGTMIIFHPCTDQFDKEHHAPYIEFVHDVLPQTRDAIEHAPKFEEKFATQPGVHRDVPRRDTPTTRPTPSSCGTGARRGGSTSGASSSSAPTTTTSPSSSAGRRRARFPEALAMAKGTAARPGDHDAPRPADRDGGRHGVSAA